MFKEIKKSNSNINKENKQTEFLENLLLVDCGIIKFKNPLILASGTAGYGEELEDFIDVSNVGGLTIKGLTLNPRKGNKGIRIYESYCGILNSIGLANIGIKNVIKKYSGYFKSLRDKGTKIIANLNGMSYEEFIEIVKIANTFEHFDYFEINISCPNVKKGGASFSEDFNLLKKLLRKIKEISEKPLIIKLSPMVNDLETYLKIIEDSGADGISLINTFKGIAIDIENTKPVFKNIFAGYSGPAIKPIALYYVYKVAKLTNLPIIGGGGIITWKDAVEFLLAGADAFFIGTLNLINPEASIKILDDITKYLKEKNFSSIKLKDKLKLE